MTARATLPRTPPSGAPLAHPPLARIRSRVVLSGIEPSGQLTLGNHLGALRRFAVDQYAVTRMFPVVDLHALTVPGDPRRIRRLTRDVATSLPGHTVSPWARRPPQAETMRG